MSSAIKRRRQERAVQLSPASHRWPSSKGAGSLAGLRGGCGSTAASARSASAVSRPGNGPSVAMRRLKPLARSSACMAGCGGWVIPYESLCLVSDKPRRMECNPTGDLHSLTGSALEFADGFARENPEKPHRPRGFLEESPDV